jgi:hypothetical protein
MSDKNISIHLTYDGYVDASLCCHDVFAMPRKE